MGEIGRILLWNWLSFAKETQTQAHFTGKGTVDARTACTALTQISLNFLWISQGPMFLRTLPPDLVSIIDFVRSLGGQQECRGSVWNFPGTSQLCSPFANQSAKFSSPCSRPSFRCGPDGCWAPRPTTSKNVRKCSQASIGSALLILEKTRRGKRRTHEALASGEGIQQPSIWPVIIFSSKAWHGSC